MGIISQLFSSSHNEPLAAASPVGIDAGKMEFSPTIFLCLQYLCLPSYKTTAKEAVRASRLFLPF